MKTEECTNHPVSLGLSSCLMGEKVRYDGGHKCLTFIVDTLTKYFNFVPYCPEVAVGMGVPRAPIQLKGDALHARACRVDDTGVDLTESLQEYGKEVAAGNAAVSGYIFKARSPSCGVWDTPIFGEDGKQVAAGSGIYMAAVQKALPLLPVVDELRLQEVTHFESFIRKVSAYHCWQDLQRSGLTEDSVRLFHENHRCLVLAHAPKAWVQLEELIVAINAEPLEHVATFYIRSLLDALSQPATIVSHTNVLLAIFADIKMNMEVEARNELAEAIADYHGDSTPWQVSGDMLLNAMQAMPSAGCGWQEYLRPHESLKLVQQGSLLRYEREQQ